MARPLLLQRGLDHVPLTAQVRKTNYRKLAFAEYEPFCVWCGFGVPEILEVAHLDGQRTHNSVGNLALLCPTCHKMHDVDLISTVMVRAMRDRQRVVRWKKRMKDAGRKAALSRRARLLAHQRKWRAAGRKAAATRKRNANEQKGQRK